MSHNITSVSKATAFCEMLAPMRQTELCPQLRIYHGGSDDSMKFALVVAECI
jgi:hypothetical protein